MPKFTDEAKALLKRLEGLRLSAYMDTAGLVTIGYGHRGPEVTPATTWTAAQAESALDRDLARFTRGVSDLVMAAPGLSDPQYSALVIFAFNVGLQALRGSTLLRVVLAGHYDAVPAQLREWVHVHDPRTGRLVVDPGLVKRRDAEVKLWNSGGAVA